MDLLELREQIDAIDRQIVSLYEQRMEICGRVAEYKIEKCLTGSGRWKSWTRSGH